MYSIQLLLLFSVFILARLTWKIPGSQPLFHIRWPQDETPQKIPAQTYGRPRVTRVSQRFRMFRAKSLEEHQQANPPKGNPMTCGAGLGGSHTRTHDKRRGQHPPPLQLCSTGGGGPGAPTWFTFQSHGPGGKMLRAPGLATNWLGS